MPAASLNAFEESFQLAGKVAEFCDEMSAIRGEAAGRILSGKFCCFSACFRSLAVGGGPLVLVGSLLCLICVRGLPDASAALSRWCCN